MNILRIVYDWPEPWVGLGPGPYFISRAQGLLGHRLTVLTGGFDKKALLKLNFLETPEKNVTVIKLPRALTEHTGPFLTSSPAALIFYLIARIISKVDIVHGHASMTLYFDLYKIFFGSLDKTIYVKHFHICAKQRRLNAISRNEKFTLLQKYLENPMHELSDKLSLKTCNQAIAVSESTKSELVKFYPQFKDKITVVENGVPTHIFKPIKDLKLDRSKIKLLSVGVLSERKGAHLIIEALKSLSQGYTLTWIGRFADEAYKSQISKLIKDNSLEERVKIIEYVSNLEIAPYFQEADLFVLPSLYEGFPKVVLEALACGLKCLVHGFKAKGHITGLDYFTDLKVSTIAREVSLNIESKITVDVDMIRKIYSWDAKAKEIDAIYSKLTHAAK